MSKEKKQTLMQQIRSILASEMESNIKKGWEEVACQ
jgi:hypothetical protein